MTNPQMLELSTTYFWLDLSLSLIKIGAIVAVIFYSNFN